jgi:ligand-binding SRPBCC domain-containing protein
MPTFETNVDLAATVERVFALFLRPAVYLSLLPPELHLSLVSGPEELQLGATLEVRGRRWGISQRMVTEVTTLERNVLLVEEQRRGPFRRWTYAHHFEKLAEGATRLTDRVEYEPPGGILGLTLTATRIEHDLAWSLKHRQRRMVEVLQT